MAILETKVDNIQTNVEYIKKAVDSEQQHRKDAERTFATKRELQDTKRVVAGIVVVLVAIAMGAFGLVVFGKPL